MSASLEGRNSNYLLASLPQPAMEKLHSNLRRVRLTRGEVLIEPNERNEQHVYFIEAGLVMLLASAEDIRANIQIGMIGREGMAGGLALLDGNSPAYAAEIVQGHSGLAQRISLDDLRRRMEDSPMLREITMRFIQSLVRQTMKIGVSAACNTLLERVVLWVLMAHERVDGDDLSVTHEALSALLGVRRSGVTVAMASLQRAGLISHGRGRIRVVYRNGLEALLSRDARGSRRSMSDTAAALAAASPVDMTPEDPR